MAPLNVENFGATNTEMEVDYDKNVTRLYESISNSEWDIATHAVKQNPAEAKTWVVRHHEGDEQEGVMWRFLPIHSACARQPPESVIAALLGAHPNGASSPDDQGMLPLHYACGNQASVEVIRLLLLAYPNGSSVADPNGMLPIHYVAQWGPSSPNVVSILLFSNRKIANARDLDGNTPLDLAQDGEYPEKDDVVFALKQFCEPEESQAPEPVAQKPVEKKEMPIVKPKTSEAVRRLQEAAAAQQRARDEDSKRTNEAVTEQREEYSFKSISSRSAFSPQKRVNAPPRMPNETSTSRQVNEKSGADETSVTDSASVTTMKQVAKLKAEVNKLRAEAAFAESEAEEKINNEREAMQSSLDAIKAKLAKSQQETMDALTELTTKEEFGQYVEERLGDKENELANALKENERLNKDLSAMKQSVEEYKEKTQNLDEHMSTLSISMESMVKEQGRIMKAAVRHEEFMKKVAVIRQQKMQELIDQEVLFARNSLEKQKQTELGSEELVNEALEKQRNLMGAVAAVLSETRHS